MPCTQPSCECTYISELDPAAAGSAFQNLDLDLTHTWLTSLNPPISCSISRYNAQLNMHNSTPLPSCMHEATQIAAFASDVVDPWMRMLHAISIRTDKDGFRNPRNDGVDNWHVPAYVSPHRRRLRAASLIAAVPYPGRNHRPSISAHHLRPASLTTHSSPPTATSPTPPTPPTPPTHLNQSQDTRSSPFGRAQSPPARADMLCCNCLTCRRSEPITSAMYQTPALPETGLAPYGRPNSLFRSRIYRQSILHLIYRLWNTDCTSCSKIDQADKLRSCTG